MNGPCLPAASSAAITAQQFAGRFYFETDNRWVYPAVNYGFSAENHSQSGGTGVDPGFSYKAMGIPLRQGETVSGVTIIGTTNNVEITGVEFRLYFQTGLWDGSWDTDGESTVTLIGVETELFPLKNVMNRYDIAANFTAPSDGMLIPVVQPSGTITARRYLNFTSLIDIKGA